MSIFSRLRRITIGRIESFLSACEDPEVIFPQLVKEMEQQLAKATEAEAQAAADVKRASREAESAAEKVKRMEDGAKLAIQEGDEETARNAVLAQIEAEQTQQRSEGILERAQATHDNARAAREQIQAQLKELRSKKDEIITRSRVAKARQNIQRSVQGSATSSESILDTVARMEEKIDEAEAELAIQEEMTTGSAIETDLDRRLKELGRQAEVENRLEALRKDVQGS